MIILKKKWSHSHGTERFISCTVSYLIFSHFPELAGQRDYSILGDQEHYPYEKSLLERAGPEGSLQELELKRSLNLEEFYVKEDETRPRDTRRWFKSTKRFV